MSDDKKEGIAKKAPRKLISDVTREKARLFIKRNSGVMKQLMKNPMGTVGVVLLVAFILMGIFGDQIAPYKVLVGQYDNRFGALTRPTSLGQTYTVNLEEGGYASVEGVFIEKPGWPGPDPAKYGLLRVTTDPALPSTIYVDGEWKNMWGLDWMKTSQPEPLISFSDIPGYVTPDPVFAKVSTYAEVTEVVGSFVECARLNISVEPMLPATILVEGFPRSEGALDSYVPPGTYNISFGAVEGYDIPESISNVTLGPGDTFEAIGTYTMNASAPGPTLYSTLKVVTVPAVPTTIIVNTNWTTQWGLDDLKLDPLPNNKTKYVVEFTDVPGYVTPNPITLNNTTFLPGEAYELEVVFEKCALLEVHVTPDISSTILVNGHVRNDGSLSVFVPEGTYHVTFRTIENYAIPEPGYAKTLMRVLPLIVFWGASVIAVSGARKPTASKMRKLAIVVAFGAIAVTSGLLAAGAAAELEVIDVPLTAWAYIVGLGAVSASLISVGLMQNIVDRDVKLALVISLLIPIPFASTLMVDVSQFVLSDLRFAAYIGAGLLVSLCGFLLVRSLRRSVLAFSLASDPRSVAYAKVVRTLKLMSVLLVSGLILSGMMIYLVQHWTPHWMGTDDFGADILSELLFGAKTSIMVGVISAVIASVLGALVGLYSGYVGGWVDEVIMRLNDIVLSIPWLVLMIIIAAMVGKIDLFGIILIIGLTGWSPTARMVRAQVLSIRERQYIERARAIGSPDLSIIRRHVLPNAFPLVFANTILTVAISILSEATLSFLGMRPTGTVTWGTMLSFAQSASAFQIGLSAWIIVPGMCIVLIVLGFSLLGYALDDIMNPKLRKR